MMRITRSRRGRRAFLRQSGAVASSVLLAAWREPEHALADELSPTPACTDYPEPTLPQTEGPFFLPRSPQRASLLQPGMRGARIVLTGRALSTQCTPVANALL